ncbi:MAG: hypothetical protein JWP27_1940 [Flaviaesturariibacter sp.]|nr:hypothetical protein [Flaviaesturariibacter sp.]
MKFLSLEPFIPSGPDFESACSLFLALGFSISWEGGGYAGFQNGACRFILQQYDNPSFAGNFMVSVQVDDAADFYKMVVEKSLVETHGIRINPPTQQPYGLEVNLIDRAGVCWHFVQS